MQKRKLNKENHLAFSNTFCTTIISSYDNLKKLLRLDGTTVSTPNTPSEGIILPKELSVSKIDNKIIINCGNPELEKASESLIVLDISALKGGALGQTRGLHVYAIDSFSDGLNEINGLI